MSIRTCNKIDEELSRCEFCGALVSTEDETNYDCLNKPLHPLRVSCKTVLAAIANPECGSCEGFGVEYKIEDLDPVEGYKMARKKACECIQ